jgi:hypothetical protein
MNLKNYTSEVPAITSMGRIEKNLVEAGATDISKKYESGVCIAIRFRMLVNQIPLFFELPAKVDACFKVLWAEVKRPQPDTKARTLQQAERTAWKIISDWVDIQLSMIKLEQAELLQIFLPYVFDPVKEKTFYSQMKEGGFKALLPG